MSGTPIDDGGPAFPTPPAEQNGRLRDGAVFQKSEPARPGMSLRDYFAAKAMGSLLTTDFLHEVETEEVPALDVFERAKVVDESLAEVCYGVADAMLSASKTGAARREIDAADARKVAEIESGWRPASDPPDHMKTVQVEIAGEVSCGYWDGRWWYDLADVGSECSPTHWKPLDAPPAPSPESAKP